MIDFAKTFPLPANIHITHHKPWQSGNHEDGYLIGVDSLIGILNELWTEMNGFFKKDAATSLTQVAFSPKSPLNLPINAFKQMIKYALKSF